MAKNSTKAYVEKFFELRPVFLEDARAGKVGVGNIVEWLREHAPDYETVSKDFGFDSIEDEISFVKELADLLKEDRGLDGYIRTLRRPAMPSESTKKGFINALGIVINRLVDNGKFSGENLAHAKDIGKRFARYGGFEDIIADVKAEQAKRTEEQKGKLNPIL